MEIITPNITRITLQNINPVNACSNILAVAAYTQIHAKAFGFLINEDNVRKNHANISNSTTEHHIATFFHEKLDTDYFFTSAGLVTWTCVYHKACNCCFPCTKRAFS